MLRQLIIITVLLALTACSNVPNEPAYRASTSKLPLGQGSFNDYRQGTEQWLQRHRAFLTADHRAEIQANVPFELKPKIELPQSRGILLVHGLLDSPYSFVDIAPMLANMGFHVRTVLLEGHGSKPADLLHADADKWRALVAEQAAIFKQEVSQLYLGGFSTGANLVTSYAIEHQEIAGLMLFSPGFKANTQVDFFAPLVSVMSDWVFSPSLKYHSNYVRYLTGPTNAFAQFYDTSVDVLDQLEAQQYPNPVFIAVSENDSIVDVKRALTLFSDQMTNPKNRLVWFGQAPPSTDSRVEVFASQLPQFHISNFSHMGLLFTPENPYYGRNGSQRICNNGQSDEAYRQCVNRRPVWYSAYGHQEDNKVHARLTFNPWFSQMADIIHQVMF